MSWKRRWGIVTVLALVQAGILVWYQGFFSGSAAPAQSPSGEKKVVVPTVEAKKATPPAAEGPAVPVASADVPASPPFVVPKEFTKDGSSVEPPVAAEPPQLPKELNSAPTVPPPPPPAAALPESNPATPPAPKGDEKLVPVKAEEVKPAGPTPDLRRLADAPPPAPSGKAASQPEYTQTYAQVQVTTPMPPPVISPAPPAAPNPNPLTPPAPISPTSPAPAPVPGVGVPSVTPAVPPTTTPPPEAAEPPCPWTLRVEMVKGRTLLTAQTGKEVVFRVSCDKLDLQSPKGSIQASGNVKVESDGLKGSCDQLMIAWQADQVVLQGNAELKCQREGQEVDLQAAKLTLRLSVSARPEQPRASTRPGDVRGTTFLSRSKSLRGDHRTPRPQQVAPGWQSPGRDGIQPTSGNSDGGYDRYLGAEPPRRGSKVGD
jgi:hypothetical protein